MAQILTDETLLGKWLNFFEERYKTQIEDLSLKYPETRSLYIDYWDIDRFDQEFAEDLLKKPEKYIYHAERAISQIDTTTGNIAPHVRFINLPDSTKQMIRDIRSKHTNKMISFEGLVKKRTTVRPRVYIAAWQCQKCGAIHHTPAEYYDILEPPVECFESNSGCGRSGPFKLLESESKNIDSQKMQIQENPESIHGGEQPQSIAVYFEDDICAQSNPGDRVSITGVLKTVRKKRQNNLSTVAEFIVKAVSINVQESAYSDIEITEEDRKEIIDVSKRENLTDDFISSIAPTVYGMDVVKKALFLQLFSGVTKHTSDGLRIRGDIHILLAGDPGTGKTQLKNFLYNMAPRGIRATGGGTTRAGLTATAVKDDFSEGQWVLEAGALVLADKGLACIDEFDKMNDDDRGAMHDAMESQQISIAKAGINATLKTRCSVLAICNPESGRFDDHSYYIQQLNMKPSLLSRFDLIFPIVDKPSTKDDFDISAHMLKTHQNPKGKHINPPFEPDFVQKYVAYAKRIVNPSLSNNAIEQIQEFYVGLRSQSVESVTITPRQLEALIRLSEAAARSRLSGKVEMKDVALATEVYEEYLKMVGLDKENNVFDIDIIETGQSHSQNQRMKSILSIIDETSYDNGGSAPLNKILHEASNQGITEDKLLNSIKHMKREGQIYEPEKDRFKLTRDY